MQGLLWGGAESRMGCWATMVCGRVHRLGRGGSEPADQDTPRQAVAIPMPERAGVGTANPTFGSPRSVFRRIPAAQRARLLDTVGMFNPAQEMATCPTPC